MGIRNWLKNLSIYLETLNNPGRNLTKYVKNSNLSNLAPLSEKFSEANMSKCEDPFHTFGGVIPKEYCHDCNMNLCYIHSIQHSDKSHFIECNQDNKRGSSEYE